MIPWFRIDAIIWQMFATQRGLRGEIKIVLSHFSGVQFFETLWIVAHQAPLSMGFSRQEYWRGWLCPPPGDLPDPGTEPTSPLAPVLQADSLPLRHQANPNKDCSSLNLSHSWEKNSAHSC